MRYIPILKWFHQKYSIVKKLLADEYAIEKQQTSVIGMLLSSYHYALQKLPLLREFSACTSVVTCSGHYINWLGFITIPFLALIAFTIITAMMLMLWKRNK